MITSARIYFRNAHIFMVRILFTYIQAIRNAIAWLRLARWKRSLYLKSKTYAEQKPGSYRV